MRSILIVLGGRVFLVLAEGPEGNRKKGAPTRNRKGNTCENDHHKEKSARDQIQEGGRTVFLFDAGKKYSQGIPRKGRPSLLGKNGVQEEIKKIGLRAPRTPDLYTGGAAAKGHCRSQIGTSEVTWPFHGRKSWFLVGGSALFCWKKKVEEKKNIGN